MKIDPKTQDKFFNILKAVVIPRPIAFVSSQSKDGVLNLAPFSFFNGVCYAPPTISVAIARFAGDKRKDSLVNIEETGEFVVNLVNQDIAQAMNKTAAEYPANVNEFEVAGLTPAASEIVSAPCVLESPVSLECKLIQVVPVNEGSPKECGLVIAEVVYCHINDELFDGRYVDMKGLDVVGRLGGHEYCKVNDLFEMRLPIYKEE
jgi:flavin reductase (DIM6/NTAB) family NADH-FMN oxidoreductase RutF